MDNEPGRNNCVICGANLTESSTNSNYGVNDLMKPMNDVSINSHEEQRKMTNYNNLENTNSVSNKSVGTLIKSKKAL